MYKVYATPKEFCHLLFFVNNYPDSIKNNTSKIVKPCSKIANWFHWQ